VGGPVFGIAGHRWHAGGARERPLALALLGAVFVAEGAHTLLEVPALAPTGWVEIAVGVAVVPLLARSRGERLTALVLLLPLALLGLVGYLAIGRLFLL
jgi:hypothetical protein